MQHVVVTGISTGIGRATVKLLTARGYHVFGSVRRDEDVQSVRAEFGGACTPLRFDVTDNDAARAAAAEVQRALGGATLAGLINNAGVAGGGPLVHMPLDRFREQIDVNVTGALRMTQLLFPLLKGKNGARPGRIINMSSVSGKIVMPFVGAYCASKFALEAVSDALRRELALYGIDVVVIEPGAVKTPIWGKAQGDKSIYQTDFGPSLQKFGAQVAKLAQHGHAPERVAECVLTALEARRPKSRYALPNGWISGWILPRLLPDRWFDLLIAKQLGLKPAHSHPSISPGASAETANTSRTRTSGAPPSVVETFRPDR